MLKLPLAIALCLFSAAPVFAQGIGPDIIVGNLFDTNSYGTDGSGIWAYSIGTDACNIGDEEASWIQYNPEHPVIAQNVYRLENGRIEQIGQSWLKHSFQALQGGLCSACTPAADGTALGVGCSDPYGAGYNGSQSNLGPRSQVNASTGVFPYPWSAPPYAPIIGRRVQILGSDLDPSLHVGALYFAEGHYVSHDDSMAGNASNNASYRPATVADDAEYTLSLTGDTVRELPAIYAWSESDPEVSIEIVDIPGDGRVHVGYRVTDNGDGTWHYEYALNNHNSHMSVQALWLPMDVAVTTTAEGFHDVDSHSGEPYSVEDWSFMRTATGASWQCETFDTNNDANALRWGTLYNCWFDSDSPPQLTAGRLSTFRPGSPTEIYFPCLAPTPVTSPLIEPVSGLACVSAISDVSLSWSNGAAYDEIHVIRAGDLVAVLTGGETSYDDVGIDPVGSYFYVVQGVIAGDVSPASFCEVVVVGVESPVDLQCNPGHGEVNLAWTNPTIYAYDTITVQRNDIVIATLPGGDDQYDDLSALPGESYQYSVQGTVGFGSSAAVSCDVDLVGVVAPTDLDCQLAAGDVTLSWTNPNPYDYDTVEIADNGLVLATLPGASTSYVDLAVGLGQRTYEVTGLFDSYPSTAASCGVLVYDGMLEGTVLVFAHPSGSGSEAIVAALASTGLDVTVQEFLTTEIVGFDACFVALGMFPGNHQLTAEESDFLVSYSAGGGRIYLEGGDCFAYDPAVSFHDIYGVDGLSDGGDDLFVLNPKNSGLGLDLSGYTTQDYTGENSWIDHLAPDVAEAGVLWSNDDYGYDCGIHKAVGLYAPIICCSYLFVGIGDGSDHEAIIHEYLGAFGILPDSPEFKRADANTDGLVDVGDPIFVLGWLFSLGPPPQCEDASDVNDSGAIDIADAVAALSFLFSSGPMPPPPFPVCGPDPTSDALDCVSTICP